MDKWNQFDFFLVCISLAQELAHEAVEKYLPLPPMLLRVLRILRVLRAVRLLKVSPVPTPPAYAPPSLASHASLALWRVWLLRRQLALGPCEFPLDSGLPMLSPVGYERAGLWCMPRSPSRRFAT